jgi:hypothetical protein
MLAEQAIGVHGRVPRSRNRIDVLAVVAAHRDPAWINTTLSERAID